MYVEHPLITEDSIEVRDYQVNLANMAKNESTLVVLPTGMGKTIVALMLIAERVDSGKVLFTAPTKPLVEQHHRFMKEHLRTEEQTMFTGETSPKKRAVLWNESRVVIATPQVIENDLLNGRISMKDVSLVVFDEAHRAVGNYAYVYIADRFLGESPNGITLGMTASPGNRMNKILTVCQNLGITWIEARTEEDPDVSPYVHKIKIQWVKVPVPARIKKISAVIGEIYEEQLEKLRSYGLLPKNRKPNVRQLLDVQKTIRKRMATGNSSSLYHAATVQAMAIKTNHAMDLAETQGQDALRNYLDKLETEAGSRGSSKATRMLVAHPLFAEVVALSQVDINHPKMDAMERIVRNQLQADPESRIIAFTHYRDTAELVTERLNGTEEVKAVRFVGQASRGEDRGLSQKRQGEIIEAFKKGVYNVLVATSVAEEGLDIPSTDLVVFYEPVPSEIRTIQRRGRTGRRRLGRVVILISGGTRDEAYYWSSNRKERKMIEELDRIRKKLSGTSRRAPRVDPGQTTFGGEDALKREASVDDMMDENGEEVPEDPESQSTLDTYVVDVRMIADMQEFRSAVVKAVSRRGILVEGKKLEVGDYIISSRVAVERKTPEDLAASVQDGRLFAQLKALKNAYPNPLLVIEGPIFSERMDDRALMGAIASVMIGFRIPVINTPGPEETARLLASLARREAREKRPPTVRHDTSPKDGEDMKQYIVEGLPSVSGTLARRLLDEFGSVKNVMNAEEDDLKRVKGLGKVKAAEIVEIIEGEWKG